MKARAGLLRRLSGGLGQANAPRVTRRWPTRFRCRLTALSALGWLASVGVACVLVATAESRGLVGLLAVVSMGLLASALYDVWTRKDVVFRQGLAATIIAVLLASGGVGVATASIARPPIAQGTLTRSGDVIPLAVAAERNVVLELAGSLSPEVPGAAVYELLIGPQHISGAMKSARGTVRIGRHRARTVESDVRVFHELRVAGGTPALTLQRIAGPLEGGLAVRVFVRPYSTAIGWLLAGLGLAAIGIVDARYRYGSFAVLAGCAMAVPTLIGSWSDPSPALEKSLVALVLGAAASGLLAMIARELARRVLRHWRPSEAHPRGSR